jgi:chromosome segregation ATPase
MTQVVYPTTNQEDSDMFHNWGRLFSKASNAIVEASDLAKALDQARGEMEQLRSEVQRVLSLNETLGQELHQVREERDEARVSLAHANDTIARVQRELDLEIQTTGNLRNDVDGLRRTISDELQSHETQITELKFRHREEVDAIRRQRDDLGFENEALHHEVTQLQGHLNRIRDALGVVQAQSVDAPVQSVA